jgi:hypothetical protein
VLPITTTPTQRMNLDLVIGAVGKKLFGCGLV